MSQARHHPILNYLRQVLGTSSAGGVSDADLLRRFQSGQDEAAFELLLWRHAAMVLHVCRQILDDADAAEDAFQATFLVFIRKATAISRREALGSWLYRVAYRIALKARAQVKKRTSVPLDPDLLASAATEDVASRDLRRMICEEVNRLPAKYRAPIVACFFEGKTHEEAALQLGWPRGTVAGRLARARELLGRRLMRRGLALTMGALLGALSVGPSQAALTGLVDSIIHTARQLAAGQAVDTVVSPRIAAWAEGVLHAMNGTRSKVVLAVVLLVGLGGAGATLWAMQQKEGERGRVSAPSAIQAGDDNKAGAGQEQTPEEAAALARNMALSRLNLKKLALAMHNFSDTYGRMPSPAKTDNKGKALLSWRVELLPYLGEQDLYQQFHRDEPWDSPHNKQLLSKMPAVFAPPGMKTRQPFSTYYQVFVSAGSPGRSGQPGAMGGGMGSMMQMMGRASAPSAGPGGAQPPRGGGGKGGQPPAMKGSGRPPKTGGAGGGSGPMPAGGAGTPGGGEAAGAGIVGYAELVAAFVKGETAAWPAHFLDGTSNTILIIEAGHPVPWTKPEDLRYAEDEPLPELGGLFPDVIQAAFADGSIHTLKRNYDEKQLRYAITANDGMPLDLSKIEGRIRRRSGGAADDATMEDWKVKNARLRRQVEEARERIRLLREEREIEQELYGEDPQLVQLREEHAHLQAELKKLREQIDSLNTQKRRAPKGSGKD
jgi:RNA polymerase sigma factor (sigma-70 family)